MTPAELVDHFIAAVSDARTPPEAAGRLLHPDYVFREWPNALAPAGSERDRVRSLEALAASRTLLERSRFEIHEHLVDGDRVASRMTWRGRLAVDAGPLEAGAELTAHIFQHTTVRDGLIWRTESFDCYERLPADGAGEAAPSS